MNWMKTFIVAGISLMSMLITKNMLAMNVWIEAIVVLGIAGILYLSLTFTFKIITIKEVKDLTKQILN